MEKQKNKEKGLGFVMDSPNDYLQSEEILSREVMQVGNSAGVRLPRKHLGKEVKILIPKNKPGVNS